MNDPIKHHTGRIALVTGGTKGIGLAIVKKLLDLGYRVAYTGRSAKSVDASLVHFDEEKKSRLWAQSCDVRNIEEMNHFHQSILQRWGDLDLVVANAGIGIFSPVDQLTLKEWNEVIDINLTGAFITLKSTIDSLKKTKGYFITIASLAGTHFFQEGAVYNASKFGLLGFTQAAMLDLRKYGIKTTTILPGSVATQFNGKPPMLEDDWKIQPEDIAQIIADLLRMPYRTLPSKIEVRPSFPPG